MDLVMLGMPGSGKGTQAARLSARMGLPWISTGEILRDAVRSETELGRRAAEYMNRGDLVPDAVVCALVEDRLARDDAREGFLLDGFPRTTAQADHLDSGLDDLGRSLDHVVFLEVSEREVVRRLAGRLVCEACGKLRPAALAGESEESTEAPSCSCGGRLVQRADDREEVVRERLDVYRENTQPLLARYEEQRLLRRVDGTGAPDEITERILGILGVEARAS